MEALRIILKQSSANYRKAGTIENKMTYPLPTPSTIIGALHNICGYTEYHPMDISIQGEFSNLSRKIYTHHLLLDGVEGDRYTLIKTISSNIFSKAYIKVAEAMGKNQDFHHYKEKKIKIYDKELLDEYCELKNNEKNDEIKEANFRAFITSPKWYEILYDIFLILHIKSDDETLKDIENNIFNLQALGRSEDFVEVVECKKVELQERTEIISNPFPMYINLKDLNEEKIYSLSADDNHSSGGTKYYLDKDYRLENGKRKFNKVLATYSTNVEIEETSENVKVDYCQIDKDRKEYVVVNFL